MRSSRRRLPSHGTVAAYVALFAALGTGASYAAEKIGSSEIVKSAVTSKHLKNKGVKRKDLGKNAVDSSRVADGALLASDFAPGQLQAGPQGPQGEPGAPATRLWASVDNDATPSILHASGVTAVEPGDFTGALIVTFDRDVSKCSFQATVLNHGGGSLNPTVTVSINTGFYEGSGLGSNQVRVQTYFDGARAQRDFDVAAFC